MLVVRSVLKNASKKNKSQPVSHCFVADFDLLYYIIITIPDDDVCEQ